MVPSRVAERHFNKQCNGDGESEIALSTEKKISQTTSKHFKYIIMIGITFNYTCNFIYTEMNISQL